MGPGGQGRVVLDALHALGCDVAGVLDDADAGSLVGGSPVLGRPESWREHLSADVRFAVAMASSIRRRAISEEVLAAGGTLLAAVHPAAYVSTRARLGRGVFVLAGSVVGPDATIGDFSIVNANCSIDHDCRLGVAVQFGPGVTLAGDVTCEDGCFLGVGVTVLPGVRIGRGAVVGGGAVVVKPVPDGVTVAGNPARPLG